MPPPLCSRQLLLLRHGCCFRQALLRRARMQHSQAGAGNSQAPTAASANDLTGVARGAASVLQQFASLLSGRVAAAAPAGLRDAAAAAASVAPTVSRAQAADFQAARAAESAPASETQQNHAHTPASSPPPPSPTSTSTSPQHEHHAAPLSEMRSEQSTLDEPIHTPAPADPPEHSAPSAQPAPAAAAAAAATPETPPKAAPRTPRVRPQPALKAASRERAVPSTRIGRVWQFGSLGMGLGLGAATEFGKRALGLSKGGDSVSAFMSDENITRIVNTLCRVRGAALKLGQMISIQDDSFLPPQVLEAFQRVRQSADFMPRRQLEKVLVAELGEDWESKFASFDRKPFAAASIGQVHQAVLHDGTEVAVKIQYPGVADSIDSDINNVLTLLNVTGVIPKGLYVEQLMDVARVELAWECDYYREAECSQRFRKLIGDDPVFYVPKIFPEHSTKRILTSELVNGTPIDEIAHLSQEERNNIGRQMLRLCLRELFDFRFMQTDPNWGNFLYDEETSRINLLDFGASRPYGREFIDEYIEIIQASAINDKEKCLHHSRTLGFLTGEESPVMANAHAQAVMILGKPFRSSEPFDFGAQDVTREIRRLVPIMLEHRLTAPPTESYSLHRKLSGGFLMSSKLKAKFSCQDIFNDIYADYHAGKIGVHSEW